MKRAGPVLAALLIAAAVMLGSSPAGAASGAAEFVEMPDVAVGDSDGDGLAEASASGFAGGPCACWCPVLGGDWQLVVAGQAAGVDTRSVLLVCGTRLVTTVDPNAVDPADNRGLDGRFRFSPGGFGRLPRR